MKPMEIVLNISCTLIFVFVYGIPFLAIGINRLKDKYSDKTISILAICLGVMFITLPLFTQALTGWEI